MTPAIEIQSLTKTYQPRRNEAFTAVNHLNLTIEPGQVFGFLGPNGAGKTTTIKMICGLIKPSSGTIKLNGYDVARNRGQAMRQVGAVLEGTRNVYWRLSALENLLYFGRLKGVYGKELNRRADMLLQELELWERRHDKIRVFSRGMQQKVAIACAFMADPPIVLLDEPTLGLDVKAALTVKNWIDHLAQQRRKTIVLTTHQLDMAQALCERVAIMNHGELLVDRLTEQMLNLFRTEFYEIKVRGHSEHLSDAAHDTPWPLQGNGNEGAEQMRILSVKREDEFTLLSCAIPDGDQLYSVVDNLRGLGLALMSVTPVEPNLEEIFINYIDGADGSGAARHPDGRTIAPREHSGSAETR